MKRRDDRRASTGSPLRQRPLADEAGFTLIELIVAMAIMAIILAGLAGALSNVVSLSGAMMTGGANEMDTRSALDSMTTQLEEAYTAIPSTAAIITMTSTEVEFYVPDEEQPFHLMKVAYELSGGNLQRAFETSTNTNGPPWTWPSPDALGAWETVASSVTNTNIFSYQEANGTTAPAAADVARVLINLTTAGAGHGTSPTTYQASATIRGAVGTT